MFSAVGELKNDPAIWGSKAQVTLTVWVDRIQNVGKLGCRLSGGKVKAFGVEAKAVSNCSQVLPTLGRCHWLARGTVPHNRGGALIADSEPRNLSELGKGLTCAFQRVIRIDKGIKFDEPGHGSIGKSRSPELVCYRGIWVDDC